MTDPDHPRLAALTAHSDLPGPHGSRSLRRGSSGSSRIPASSPARIPVAVSTAKIAASRRWPDDRPWHAFASAESSSLVNTGTSFFAHLRGTQPGHRVRELFLVRQPAEELLQSPELIAGISVAVPGEQMDQPSLHVMAADLVPLGAPGALDQVSRSKPRHRLNIGPHRLRRLALGRQVQPERSDLRRERPGIQGLDPPGTRLA